MQDDTDWANLPKRHGSDEHGAHLELISLSSAYCST